MMGAVKTPDLYQCAVSLNGVFDLRKLLRSRWNYVGDEMRGPPESANTLNGIF